jgi:hypothetical protein
MTSIAHHHTTAPAGYDRALDRDSASEEARAITRHVRATGSSLFRGMRLLPAARRSELLGPDIETKSAFHRFGGW